MTCTLNKMVLSLSVICIVILSIHSPALAADADERRVKLLERYPEADADNNGILSNEEMREFVRNRKKSSSGDRRSKDTGFGGLGFTGQMSSAEILSQYPHADSDGDGKLSGKERRAFMQMRQAEMGKELLAAHPELDIDGDGVLSSKEHRVGRKTISEFQRAMLAEQILANHPEADRDGDGILSSQEMAAYRKGYGGQEKSQPTMFQLVNSLIKNFARYDLDGNGQLSKEELEAIKKKLSKKDEAKKRVGTGSKKGNVDNKNKLGTRNSKAQRKNKDKKQKDDQTSLQ
ncbi:MAG: hypothetical protein JSV03_15080 [Planctomycetota bacterium]|nr:MAG: hypothetical protein JSV03_15080 [Planctomycetota bacterium]